MTTHDSSDSELTYTLEDVRMFLCGEATLDGLSFGEVVPSRPVFWWRKHLRAAVAHAKADREAAVLEARIDELKRIPKPLLADKSGYAQNVNQYIERNLAALKQKEKK